MSDAIIWTTLALFNFRNMAVWHRYLDENEPLDGFDRLASMCWSAIIYAMLSWCSASCVVAFTRLIAEAAK